MTAEKCLNEDWFEDLKNLQDDLTADVMLKQFLAEKICQEKLGEQDHVYQDFKKQVTLRETDTDIDASPIVYSVQNVTGPAVGEIRAKVEQIVSLENISDTDENKIDRLKQIEEKDYKPFIQQLAYKETQEELNDLVEVLADLGYLTTKLGELSGELKYYTDAAVFYQYVITILNEKLTTESKNTFTKQELTNPYQQLSHIQELIFSAIGGDREKMPVVSEEATINKKILSKLRLRADLRMKVIEINYRRQVNDNKQEEKQKYQALYVKAARGLFEDTANVMQKFLAKLYSDSERELKKHPPCKYAVIGLGSMALKQMTPYSDLEFAILIESEGRDDSEGSKIKQYFKNLSYLVNFKMVNLGETIIPTSKYKLDMSHLVHRGVNFDLGGKTPLGRIEGDKKYELIKTIDRMLYYVRNEGDKASKIDKNLPYILEKVCYVHGNDDLVREYQDKVKKFLHSKNDQQGTVNCEARAIKLLTEQVVEFNYSEQTLSLDPKKGDLDKLQPDFSLYAEGKLFDVKQEIYRLPDRMVYNLGMYYGIDGDSAWDTIDKLKYKEVINSEAAVNLKNAVTFATTLRLKTYLHNKAQTEDISIFVKPAEPESEHKAQARQIFHLSQKDLEEHGGLFQYFYTALPLHSLLENFCMQYQTLDNVSKETFFQNNGFYLDDNVTKGFIYYRLSQYQKVQRIFEEDLVNSENQDNFQFRLMLGKIYNDFGKRKKAIEQIKYCLKKINQYNYQNQPHPFVAGLLNNLGLVYFDNGKNFKAIKILTKSVEMRELIYKDQTHPDIAHTFNSLGGVYCQTGQFKMAKDYLTKSLNIRKRLYKDEPHLDIADSYNNFGDVFYEEGHYDQAEDCYIESLKIRKFFFKGEPHPFVASSLNNLGNLYCRKGQHDKAIEYLNESLKIYKHVYETENHPSIADCYNNLGNVYSKKGQHDKAANYFTQSLDIRTIIFEDKRHLSIVSSLINLGVVYRQACQDNKAIEYFTQSLDIMKRINKDETRPFFVDAPNNLGEIYKNKKQYDKAIEYYNQSLEIYKLIHKNKPHQDIFSCLENLFSLYKITRQSNNEKLYSNEHNEMMKLIFTNSSSIY